MGLLLEAEEKTVILWQEFGRAACDCLPVLITGRDRFVVRWSVGGTPTCVHHKLHPRCQGGNWLLLSLKLIYSEIRFFLVSRLIGTNRRLIFDAGFFG